MTKARRPGLIVATALKRKYGELKGRDAYLFADHAAIRADMAHVGAVLAMFDPGADLAAIPARRPKKPNGGRWTRTALGILKRANRPLKAYELARLVMSELGVPPDRATLFSIGCALQSSLARLEARGLVRSVGKPRRWAVLRD